MIEQTASGLPDGLELGIVGFFSNAVFTANSTDNRSPSFNLQGFQDLAVLEGGFRAWVLAGLPVETSPPGAE